MQSAEIAVEKIRILRGADIRIALVRSVQVVLMIHKLASLGKLFWRCNASKQFEFRVELMSALTWHTGMNDGFVGPGVLRFSDH